MTKNWKNLQSKFFFTFFGAKIEIYLSLGLHKGRSSYRRNLHTSNENITSKLEFSSLLWVILALLDPANQNECRSVRIRIRVRVRIRNTNKNWLKNSAGRREIITVRGQSYVLRLSKYWPPPTPLSALRVCTLLRGGGHTRRVERGVNILEDARHSSVLYLYRILFGAGDPPRVWILS